jgi:hypothetical protein
LRVHQAPSGQLLALTSVTDCLAGLRTNLLASRLKT